MAEERSKGSRSRTSPADDPLRRPLLETLQAALGDELVGFELAGDDLWVRVTRAAWYRTFQVCKEQLGLTYFCFLSGLDWKPNPDLLGEKVWEGEDDASPGALAADEDEEDLAGSADEAAVEAEEQSGRFVTGVAGGDTRFQVFARLYNVEKKVGVTLKVDLDPRRPPDRLLVPLYRGADWHERETWEMYGFDVRRPPRAAPPVPARRVRGPPAAQGLSPAGPAGEALARTGGRRALAGRAREGEGGEAAEEA